MREYLTTIPQNTVNQIVQYLDKNIEPLLETKPSGYAKGRNQLWLNYSPDLNTNPTFVLAHIDERIWNYIKSKSPQWFTPHVALITKGGGIAPHRDATYANYPAMSINLGKVTWHYEPSRPDYSHHSTSDRAPAMSVDLTGGEVFMFNCKNMHWVTNVDPNRWSINVWTISPKTMDAFEHAQKIYKHTV